MSSLTFSHTSLGFSLLAQGQEVPVRINADAYQAWINKGAQPSDRVAALFKKVSKAQATA